ncbi:hypothetical protein [Thalassoglobus neptunius]|nr:hypothetical protein [Thalassoglobus neptunius]
MIAAVKDKRLVLPTVNVPLSTLKVGDICAPHMHHAEVVKIIDADTAILRLEAVGSDAQEREIMVSEFPTEGMAPGHQFEFGLNHGKVKYPLVLYVFETVKHGSGVILHAVSVTATDRVEIYQRGIRVN